MKELSRRNFLGSCALGAGALACRAPAAFGNEETPKKPPKRTAIDRVKLGQTDVVASRLAIGTGFKAWARKATIMKSGQEHFTKIVRNSMDHGINFLDTADLYGTHSYLKKALEGVPQDQYVTLTKIWTREEPWNGPSGGAKVEVDRFRKEMGVDKIDVCLLHCQVEPNWPETCKRARDELSELKQRKKVGAVGCSFHDFESLKVGASHPWVDVILARINNTGDKMDASPKEVSEVLKQARANGKAVIGMKIYGEGRLLEGDQMDASLNYVLGNELVDAMTIGALEPSHVTQNIERIDKALMA